MTHILITGGTRGIGRALCASALAQGWQVSCTLRAGAALPGVTGWPLEMRDLDGLDNLAQSIDPLDIVIHNAGIIGPPGGPLGKIDPATFAEVMQVNALAPLAITRALLPRLRPHARILAISSQMAWMGYGKSDSIAYRMSKTALNKGVQALANDLAPLGHPCVAIDPGWVRTDMGGPGADRSPDEVADQIIALAGGLRLNRTGRFLKTDGSQRDW